MSRYEEFDKRVGNTEEHFCSECGKKKLHIWKKEKRGLLSSYHTFSLKCKDCGHEEMIYSTE